jgi:hypothetical protein
MDNEVWGILNENIISDNLFSRKLRRFKLLGKMLIGSFGSG